jgi:hypothetical protein
MSDAARLHGVGDLGQRRKSSACNRGSRTDSHGGKVGRCHPTRRGHPVAEGS